VETPLAVDRHLDARTGLRLLHLAARAALARLFLSMLRLRGGAPRRRDRRLVCLGLLAERRRVGLERRRSVGEIRPSRREPLGERGGVARLLARAGDAPRPLGVLLGRGARALLRERRDL